MFSGVSGAGGTGVAGTVRLKRGAGAGWTMPSISISVSRSRKMRVLEPPRPNRARVQRRHPTRRTPATHSSRERCLNMAARICFGARPRRRVHLPTERRRVDLEQPQQLGIEFRFDSGHR